MLIVGEAVVEQSNLEVEARLLELRLVVAALREAL